MTRPGPDREPVVSVVVPTYNRHALVAQAVDSVLSQTHEDFELIVVDDGSTDGTADALRRQLRGDARGRVLEKENGGTASARNLGISSARAPWTAFLDSDDLWEPGYLASQLAALDARPQADLVLGDATYVNQGREASSLFADPDFRAPTSLEAMCFGGWALPSAMVVRTEIAQALRFSDRYRIVEDTDFLFRFHIRGHHLILNRDRLVSWRRPEGESAPAKSASTYAVEAEMLTLLEGNRHLAGNRKRLEHRLYTAHRTVAKHLVRQGRYRQARPHLRAWSHARPLRLRPRLYYLRSVLFADRAR